MTITKRVLAYLREQPGDPNEIAKALSLTKRGYGYRWGRWSFAEAEEEGLIEWRGHRWHISNTRRSRGD